MSSALPTIFVNEKLDEGGTRITRYPGFYAEICENCDSNNDIGLKGVFKQTKDVGQMAWDHITDAANTIGSSVSGFAGEVLQSGLKHTSDLLASGQRIVYKNIEDVKRLGKEGMVLADKAVYAASNFFSDHLPNFPFEFGGDEDSKADNEPETYSIWHIFE